MAQPVYLDYNATTPLDPALVAALVPDLETHFCNPSRWTADAEIERAVAELSEAVLALREAAQLPDT